VGLMIFLFFFQSVYIYRPVSEIINTPDHVGLSYEDVHFEMGDGVKLNGWLIPSEKPKGVILFCHSNMANISYYLDSVQVFQRLGLGTFIFDYPGYGQSEGKTTEQGTYLAAEAAWRYLVRNQKVSPDEIIVLGRSLGGAIGSWLAKGHNPKALIVESAFTSFRDIGAKHFPYLPVKLIARYNYNTVEYVRQVKCPILIIHSRDDEIVPYSHGRRLFDSANEPKAFLEISGMHNDGFITSGKQYTNGLNTFITKHVGK